MGKGAGSGSSSWRQAAAAAAESGAPSMGAAGCDQHQRLVQSAHLGPGLLLAAPRARRSARLSASAAAAALLPLQPIARGFIRSPARHGASAGAKCWLRRQCQECRSRQGNVIPACVPYVGMAAIEAPPACPSAPPSPPRRAGTRACSNSALMHAAATPLQLSPVEVVSSRRRRRVQLTLQPGFLPAAP